LFFSTLREELISRVSGKKALRRMIETNKEEMSVAWRKLHSENFHDWYPSSNILRVINQDGKYGRD
jgi:hypothetical protein